MEFIDGFRRPGRVLLSRLLCSKGNLSEEPDKGLSRGGKPDFVAPRIAAGIFR